jgi:excisionase family DNA binding protein
VKRHNNASQNGLTTGDVARIFEVKACTVRRWCAEGRIKSHRSGPRSYRRFLREDVAVAYLDRSLRRYFRHPVN